MEQKIKVFKALGNPTRLRFARDLARCPSKSCGDLTEKLMLSQPTFSRHFQRLVEAGVVIESKFHTQKIYKLNHSLLADCGIDSKKL